MVDRYFYDNYDQKYYQNVFSQYRHEPVPQYGFRDIGVHSGAIEELKPDVGLQFNNFDSAKLGWWLSKRELSTPEEYEVTDSVPYMQGEYDFSMLDNQRFFKTRDMKYEFLIVDDDPQYRQWCYDQGKNLLMQAPYQEKNLLNAYSYLYDTGSYGYKFHVKCKSVSASDDDEKGVMTVTVEFKGDPFAMMRSPVGSDVWDEIDFDNYLEQETEYHVSGFTSVQLVNPGMPTPVDIDVNGKVEIRWPGTGTQDPFYMSSLQSNNYPSHQQRVLPSGDVNNIGLSGDGNVIFNFSIRMMY